MLFNSYEFVGIFLPVTLVLYWAFYAAGRAGIALVALLIASLIFYAVWSLAYLPLLVGSLTVNYLFGLLIGATAGRRRWVILSCGVIANVALLIYFKYSMFLAENVDRFLGLAVPVGNIILPIGISFYTFQQIAYLVDCYRGVPRVRSAVRYFLFVSFFPHLIAGPITHHGEVMPQLGEAKFSQLSHYLAVGITIFGIGLFKKVVIADTLSVNANTIFALASSGAGLSFLDSWIGALSYTLQIYFDFSGYSDMAVGLAWMFGVVFPINFASPYKATSIIDFWQRWHITLSRFLRDYIYIPLGGNRVAPLRRYANVFGTMLIGGIWHGAGWTYVIWGAMHGFFIVINHAARNFVPRTIEVVPPVFWHALTLLCVVTAWVMFRAPNLSVALNIYQGMVGMGGVPLTSHVLQAKQALFYIALFGGIVFFLPNTAEWMKSVSPVLPTKGYPATFVEKTQPISLWRPSRLCAAIVAVALIVSLMMMGNAREFIYFQF